MPPTPLARNESLFGAANRSGFPEERRPRVIRKTFAVRLAILVTF